MIEIRDNISISEDELLFKFSRSSGPGGQNVNKVNTRVTLLFDCANSPNLTEAQKKRILTEKLLACSNKILVSFTFN